MPALDGRAAIVTGGATLIGRAVVRALHDAGASVAVADIDEEGGEALADELGEDVLFVPTDLRADAQVEALVANAVARFGGLDILINLATSYLDEGFASPREDWLESLNVNVVAPVMTARAAHPHLKAGGHGVIVNFTSISAKVAQTGRWLYPVGKAALVQLTRNMAMDLAPDGIRVNSVSPGWTHGERARHARHCQSLLATSPRRSYWPAPTTSRLVSACISRWSGDRSPPSGRRT